MWDRQFSLMKDGYAVVTKSNNWTQVPAGPCSLCWGRPSRRMQPSGRDEQDLWRGATTASWTTRRTEACWPAGPRLAASVRMMD